jgi:hypothetical protein
MKWWNQWARKHDDGWVERRRRFLKTLAERIPGAPGQKVPAVVGVTVPETRVTVRARGEK